MIEDSILMQDKPAFQEAALGQRAALTRRACPKRNLKWSRSRRNTSRLHGMHAARIHKTQHPTRAPRTSYTITAEPSQESQQSDAVRLRTSASAGVSESFSDTRGNDSQPNITGSLAKHKEEQPAQPARHSGQECSHQASTGFKKKCGDPETQNLEQSPTRGLKGLLYKGAVAAQLVEHGPICGTPRENSYIFCNSC